MTQTRKAKRTAEGIERTPKLRGKRIAIRDTFLEEMALLLRKGGTFMADDTDEVLGAGVTYFVEHDDPMAREVYDAIVKAAKDAVQ